MKEKLKKKEKEKKSSVDRKEMKELSL